MLTLKQIVIILPFLVTACSVTSDMKEMKGNTKEMNDTTKDLLKQMGQTNTSMEKMLPPMTNMNKNTTQLSGQTGSMATSIEGMSGKMDQMRDELKVTNQKMDKMENMDRNMEKMLKSMGRMEKNTEKLTKGTVQMDKKLGKMLKSTKSMAEKMVKLLVEMTSMKDSMGEMDGVLKHLLATLENTSIDVKQGLTVALRSLLLDDMKKTTNMSTKILKAGLYVMSFEFQIWKGAGADDEVKKQVLATSGVDEFLRQIQEFVTDQKDLNPTHTDENNKNLYALVAAMGEINPNQSILAKKKSIPQISILSLISKGLGEKDPNNEDLRYQDVAIIVSENKDLAVYLLQLRHNLLTTAGMAEILGMKLGGANSGTGLSVMLSALKDKPEGSVNPDLMSLDSGKFKLIQKYLLGAIETRLMLEKLGIESEIQGTVGLLLKIVAPKQVGDTDINVKTRNAQRIVQYVGKLRSWTTKSETTTAPEKPPTTKTETESKTSEETPLTPAVPQT